jgi:hypothetical protein
MLLEFLKGKDRVAMQDAATKLNVPLETIQAWTDFLVEEKILGVEYRFTKPFLYLNAVEKPKAAPSPSSLQEIKQEYLDRAKSKQIPAAKIQELWSHRVQDALNAKRDYFFEQASRRNIKNPQEAWDEYRKDLTARC